MPLALRLMFAALVVYAYFLSLNPLGDPDLWFHLRTGQMTYETGQLPPDVDPFSYTTPNPIPSGQLKGMRTQWLGQTVLYLVFDALGAKGLAILRSLMIVLPFMIFYLAALRRGASPSALLFVLGAPLILMVNALYGTFERPQAFSFLLAPVVYYIAMRLRGGFSVPLSALLVAIMLLWANLHGGYIVGIALLMAVAAGVAASMAAGRFFGVESVGGRPERPVSFFLVLFAAIAVTSLNPAGGVVHNWALGLVKGLFSPAGHGLRSGAVMTQIQEYRPVWSFYGEPFKEWLYAATACYVITLVALCLKYVNQRRVDLPEVFAAVLMVFFGLAYMRGISFALIFTAMVGSMSLAYIPGRRLMAVAVSSALVLVLFAGSLAAERAWLLDPRPVGYWVSDEYPERSLDFLDSRDVRGRLFNLMGWGGYIIWRSYPERQVFFDGRDISAGVMELYSQVIEARPGWREVLDAYGVDIMLIPVLSGGNGVLTPIIFRMALEGPGHWRLVFLDHNQVVFVREGAEGTASAIECCQMPFERLYGHIVDVAAIRLLSQPGHPETMISQAFGLFWSGRYAEVLRVLGQVPDSPVSLQLRREAAKALGLQRGQP